MTKTAQSSNGYVPRLKARYLEVARPALLEEFKYANPMRVPHIEKVVLNMGIGEATADRKKVEQIWGMDIIVCTSARTDDEARALLKQFNFPFRQ